MIWWLGLSGRSEAVNLVELKGMRTNLSLERHKLLLKGRRNGETTDGSLAFDNLDDPRSIVGRLHRCGAETKDMKKGGLLIRRSELCGLVVQGSQGDHDTDAVIVVLGEL